MNYTNKLLSAIQHKDTTMIQLGKLYSQAALSGESVDWKLVHDVILERWIGAGLTKVQLIAIGYSMMEGLKVWK